MKKKMLAIVLAALLCCGVFAGCDNGAAPTPKEIIFSAVAPISIKLNQADANLLAGVTATQGDKSVTVTVDKSKVDFTKPGEYEITYTAGDVKKANKVFVYAMPKFFYKDAEIVEKSVNISYKDATLNNKFKKHITAKDSFNVALEVTITEIDTFEGEYGTYKAKYKAEDKAGNVADNEVAYAVLTDGAPIIANTNCDLFVDLVGGDIGIDIDLDGAEELDVFNGTTELSDSDGGDYEYNTVTNKLHFAAAYVKGLGVGTHTLTVKTVNGYTN